MNDIRSRGKGWRRLSFALAIAWLPITGILTPVFQVLGGIRDEEVLTFFFSGVVLFVVLGLLAPWVARGFDADRWLREAAKKEPPQ